jgi:GT2 family glycosyltransferase
LKLRNPQLKGQQIAPEVCIIVLNWNGWRDTLDCLDSLEKLNYPSYEVVVVDNGSADGSEERIRERCPYVAIVQTGANLGFARGNNSGIEYALGQGVDLVWLLNNDTLVEPGALTAMVAALREDGEVGAVGSVLRYMDEPDRIQCYGGGWIRPWLGMSRWFTSPAPDEVLRHHLQYIVGASLLIRREAIERTGLLDEGFFMYWEDADFGFRLLKDGWRLAVAPESTVWHKDSVVPGKSETLDFNFNASAVRYFYKHSRLPLVPVLIGVGGRFAKRVLRGDWARARAVARGAFAGWQLALRSDKRGGG